jgi:hypothetical protein
MGILAKIFNFVPRKERERISLGHDAYWQVAGEVELSSLLRALPKLMPESAILYLEGGSPPRKVKSFLDEHCVPEVTHLETGTIWPRPRTYHLPATSGNLTDLAKLCEKCVAFEVAIHFHVYEDKKVLLEWYDAFCNDPMYLSRDIAEGKVRAFCDELSLQYNVCKDCVESSAGSDEAKPGQ